MSLMSRKPLWLALAASVTLAACSGSEAPAPAAPAQDAPPATSTPAPSASEAAIAAALDAAIANPARTPANVERDAWRHPRETLAFFGVKPTDTVLEITPGGGWYTEILAPYLRDQGRYIGVLIDPASATSEGSRNYYARSNEQLRARLAENPAAYDKGVLVEIDPAAPVLGEPDSADAVLTFRNVHNWIGNNSAQAMFDAFFAVLKPGGVLGVVEHRANQDVPEGDRSGYLSEAQVITFARAAGFEVAGRSEINANPNDTKDHPNGVWTLPPGLNVPEGEDAQKYRDIGESDRMTLKFVKPLPVQGG